MKVFGEYEALEKLGKGGFGRTYRASRNGEFYALKELLDVYGSDAELRERFVREVRALKAIESQNVVHYVDHAPEDGSVLPFFIVMELLEGRSLEDTLDAAHGRLPQHEVIDYALQILRGLAAAHRRGIIHRDIKPENVMVCKSGSLKLIDFGLVRLEDARRITGDQAVLGTPGYIAPEILTGHVYDQRADVFSYGVLLYKMACGQLPFGTNIADFLDAVRADKYPDPEVVSPGLDPRIAAAIRGCLRFDVTRRFGSCDLVAEALAAAVPSVPRCGAADGAADVVATPGVLTWIDWNYRDHGAIARAVGTARIDALIVHGSQAIRYAKELGELAVHGVDLLIDPRTAAVARRTWRGHQLGWMERMGAVRPAERWLNDEGNRRSYVSAVLQWQRDLGGRILVSPFHAAAGSSLGVRQMDARLVGEAREWMVRSGGMGRLVCRICTSVEELAIASKRMDFTSVYTRYSPDVYWIEIDGWSDALSGRAELECCLEFITGLRGERRQVVLGCGGVSALLAIAGEVDGVSQFAAAGRGFRTEDLIRGEPESGMQVRYFSADLLSFFGIDELVEVMDRLSHVDLSCECEFCEGRRGLELRSVAREHFIYRWSSDSRLLSFLTGAERRSAILRRVDRAASLLKESGRSEDGLRRRVLGTWRDLLAGIAASP